VLRRSRRPISGPLPMCPEAGLLAGAKASTQTGTPQGLREQMLHLATRMQITYALATPTDLRRLQRRHPDSDLRLWRRCARPKIPFCAPPASGLKDLFPVQIGGYARSRLRLPVTVRGNPCRRRSPRLGDNWQLSATAFTGHHGTRPRESVPARARLLMIIRTPARHHCSPARTPQVSDRWLAHDRRDPTGGREHGARRRQRRLKRAFSASACRTVRARNETARRGVLTGARWLSRICAFSASSGGRPRQDGPQ
jgi:hypothetical protein